MTNEKKLSKTTLVFFAVIIVLCVASLLSYLFLDQAVYSILEQSPVSWQENSFVTYFTLLGKAWLPIWLLLFWALAAKQFKPAFIGIFSLIIIIISVSSIKLITQRSRPRDVTKASTWQDNTPPILRSWSFPSGDAAAVFAVSAAITPFVAWPWIPVLFAASSGVALFRVTSFAHYPSDVLAGAALGIFAGLLAQQIIRRWRDFDKILPQHLRFLSFIAIIAIPISIGLSKGLNFLLTFLATYGVLAVTVYIISKITARLKHSGSQNET